MQVIDSDSKEAAQPPPLKEGWAEKQWIDGSNVTTYWEDVSTGQYTLQRPEVEPAPALPAVVEVLQDQFVDPYVFVGILSPQLAEDLRSGKNTVQTTDDAGDSDPIWQQKEVIKAACKVTLLWPNSARVTGPSVAAAIKRNDVAWPSVRWWRETVLGEFAWWGVGKVHDKNYGGGTWEKPAIPDQEADAEKLWKDLAHGDVTKEQFEEALPNKRQQR